MVISALTSELDPAMAKMGRHVGCPVHGGSDGFRLFRDFEQTGGGCCNSCGVKSDGFSLLTWVTGMSLSQVVRAVEGVMGGIPKTMPKKRSKPTTQPLASKNADKLKCVWSEALPNDTLLEKYCESRQIGHMAKIWSKQARVHPSLPYYQHDDNDNLVKLGDFPCILTVVKSGRKAITLHRTFITENGEKAPVPKAKKLMPLKEGMDFTGSAIELGGIPKTRTLCVAEGIETALAVTAQTGQVCWSLVSASNLAQFTPPKGIQHIMIYADKDRPDKLGRRAGIEAAKTLAARMADMGVSVDICLPLAPIPEWQKSLDWLDVYAALMKLDSCAVYYDGY